MHGDLLEAGVERARAVVGGEAEASGGPGQVIEKMGEGGMRK